MNALDLPALAMLHGSLVALAVKWTLVFLLAFTVARFAKSFTPERRHTLWLVVLFVFTVLPVAQLALPLVRVPLLAPSAPAPARLPEAVERPAPPVLDEPTIQGSSAATSEVPERRGGPPGSWIALAIVGAWLAGALGVLLRPLGGRLALARTLKSGARSPGPDALLDELAREAGIRSARVYAHPRVMIPFLYGILHPTILLPHSWRAWPRGRLEAVLLHELAHVKRRDALTSAAAQIACALVWFNPLAWAARRMLVREAESSCDRAVLAHGVSRTEYASAIVDILWRSGGAPLRGAWSTLGTRGMLRQRIARILSPVPRSDRGALRRGRILALAICLTAPFFLLSVSFRGAEKLYGTWRRPDPAAVSPEVLQAWSEVAAGYITFPELPDNRYAWNEDGTGHMALAALPDVPAQKCRFTIDGKWTDSDGYTWYRIQARWSGMPFLLYTVIRLHPSGNLYEVTDSPLGYPDGFLGPPGDEKHQVYVRL